MSTEADAIATIKSQILDGLAVAAGRPEAVVEAVYEAITDPKTIWALAFIAGVRTNPDDLLRKST